MYHFVKSTYNYIDTCIDKQGKRKMEEKAVIKKESQIGKGERENNFVFALAALHYAKTLHKYPGIHLLSEWDGKFLLGAI